MGVFDPSKNRTDPNKKRTYADDVPLEKPGTYLLAFVYAKPISETDKGNAFMRFKAKVIHGPFKDQAFWPDVFLTPGAMQRLGALTESMGLGQDDTFDTESSEEVRKALIFKPFKAKVATRRNNGKTYADIKYAETDVSEEERAIMRAWLAENSDRRRGDDASTGRARENADGFPDDDDDGYVDDDIPF